MSSIVNPEKSRGKSLSLLRTMALVAVVAGAAGSLGLVLYAGRQTPVFLLILFVG